ncbi:Hypothetical predicted protein [Octopus vulgaris]|uniref:Uncharacterized protein n=1 Tax=Octopus vulgaris TaxID=6645 RepID=A0AA36ASP2_OCTVU|nr:Hypothetical predicted protein [Octopus vulgaris]
MIVSLRHWLVVSTCGASMQIPKVVVAAVVVVVAAAGAAACVGIVIDESGAAGAEKIDNRVRRNGRSD